MSRRTAMALLLLANALWGASYLAARVALNTLPPPLVGALRFSIASLLLWPLLLARARWGGNPRRAAPWRVQPTDFPRLLGLGLVGVAVNHLVTNWGQSLTTATDAALLIIGEVVFTSLLAARVHRERMGRWKRVGAIVGAAGVAALVLGNRGGRGGGGLARVGGDGLIMAGLFAESVYTVLGVGLSRKYGPVALLALVYAASLLVWLPTLAWYAAGGHLPPVGPAAAAGVLYLALANSLLCPLIWFKVLPHSGSGMGAVSLLAQPLVGAVLGIGVLHEPLTLGVVVGGCLVMLALYLGSLPDRSIPAGPDWGPGTSLQPAAAPGAAEGRDPVIPRGARCRPLRVAARAAVTRIASVKDSPSAVSKAGSSAARPANACPRGGMAVFERIGSGSPWEPLVGYSRAVRAGRMVYVAGTTGTDAEGRVTAPGDAYAQTVHALRKVEAALARVGARLEHVVRTRIYVTDISRWEEVGRAHGEFFRDIRPAATMVEVPRLIHPDMLVEIEAEAVLPDEGAGC